MKVGFIGRTKTLFDTIQKFRTMDDCEISFIWTCKDELYYEFPKENFKLLSRDLGCSFIDSPKIEDHIHEVDADIVISINFINVIPLHFINKFKYGILNAHAGDLPRYRGNACPNWAILNDEPYIGLTIHKMDEGLDSGNIIVKEYFDLNPDIDITDVYRWFEDCIPNAFYTAYNKVKQGFPGEQQIGRALRTFPRKPEDSRLELGRDSAWNHRLIRASSKPFSGAYCFLNDLQTKVTFFKAETIKLNYDYYATDGQILEQNDDQLNFVLAFKIGALKITEFEIEGLSKEESYNVITRSTRNRFV